ncbi:MAG: CapA family protein [Bifidobacteriaceae bacterium]|jgi:poly-gamma-glutamate synthesis protein (capsule biosynthesis protein)|nr:CapA family protein [Bifidobacteriaceae bacterium]
MRRRLAFALAFALAVGGSLGFEIAWLRAARTEGTAWSTSGGQGAADGADRSPPTVGVRAFPDGGKRPPPDPPDELTVTLAFGGDVLTHMPVNQSAATGSTYDFTPLLAGVDTWIAGADLAICQLEVPLTPPGVAPSGYPVFGAPDVLIRDLAEQGWDGCTTSSNHSLDRGWAGVEHTIATLQAHDMGYSGTALSAADATSPQLYRLTLAGQSITVAHIAATYGTNGIPIPASQPWCVNTPIDVDKIVAAATEARAAGADIVIATIHAGVEYLTTPTDEQRAIAEQLAASGQIDAMVGDHPHVAEPIELVDGGVGGDGMWTIYSLGNFISNQTDAVVGPNTDTGVVAYLTVTKDTDGARVTAMTWAGVTVDTAHGHRLHMLEDAAAAGGQLGQIGAAGVATRYTRLRAILGAAPEQIAPPTPSGAVLEVLPRG